MRGKKERKSRILNQGARHVQPCRLAAATMQKVRASEEGTKPEVWSNASLDFQPASQEKEIRRQGEKAGLFSRQNKDQEAGLAGLSGEWIVYKRCVRGGSARMSLQSVKHYLIKSIITPPNPLACLRNSLLEKALTDPGRLTLIFFFNCVKNFIHEHYIYITHTSPHLVPNISPKVFFNY